MKYNQVRCKECGYKVREYPSGLIKERHRLDCRSLNQKSKEKIK